MINLYRIKYKSGKTDFFLATEEDKIEEYINTTKDLNLIATYIADSYGALYPLDVTYLFDKFNINGIHTHDNMGLAFANCLEAINLAPYTYESDYYIEKCIIEELPEARYTDGTWHTAKLHKGQEYYYGPNYSEKELVKYRKKDAVRKLVTLLKQRITKLERSEDV